MDNCLIHGVSILKFIPVAIIKTEIINSDLKFYFIIIVDKFGVKGSVCKK